MFLMINQLDKDKKKIALKILSMLEGLTVNEAAAILCGLEKDLGQIARLKDVTKDIGGD